LIIRNRIGKKEVKGCEAAEFTLEFFVCYPYNIEAMNGKRTIEKKWKIK